MFGKLLRYVPAPALILLAGLFLLWLMGRLDGAQTDRLAELDRQEQVTADLSLQAGKRHRETVKASEAAQAQIARLRAAGDAAEASRQAALRLAGQWKDSAEAVLAGLDTAQAQPVRQYIAGLEGQIAAGATLLKVTREVADSLESDRNRWRSQALDWKADSERWRAQSGQWKDEAKRGCWPIVGCVSRTAVFVVGAAAGAVGASAF